MERHFQCAESRVYSRNKRLVEHLKGNQASTNMKCFWIKCTRPGQWNLPNAAERNFERPKETTSYSMLSIVKMVVLPKVIYGFEWSKLYLSICLFVEFDELILKLCGNAMDLEWLKQLWKRRAQMEDLNYRISRII